MPHHHARACQATEEELPIVDVSPPVFQLLLEHLYTDSSAVPEESALELFAAADRFGVERLRALCSDRIEGMLSAANVCDVLTVADQAKRGRAEAPILPVPLPRLTPLPLLALVRSTTAPSWSRRPCRTSSRTLARYTARPPSESCRGRSSTWCTPPSRPGSSLPPRLPAWRPRRVGHGRARGDIRHDVTRSLCVSGERACSTPVRVSSCVHELLHVGSSRNR